MGACLRWTQKQLGLLAYTLGIGMPVTKKEGKRGKQRALNKLCSIVQPSISLNQNFSGWRPCSSFLSRNDDAGMATKKLGEENWRIQSEKSWVQVCNILSLKCTEHFNFECGYQCCLFEIQGYMSRISAQPLVINMIQLWRKLVSGLLSLQEAKILSQIVQHQIHHINCCMLILCVRVLQSMQILTPRLLSSDTTH